MAEKTRYGGRLLHHGHDEYGSVEVVDDGACRSLHFGSEPKQSAMLTANPHHLHLSYTRAMTAALLFHEQPRRILLVGLGGGSLAKFLLHHYPEAQIDAIELRETVVAAAQDFFGLPEDPRLHIEVADAAWFINHSDESRYGEYDLIMVDAFVSMGISRSVIGCYFHDACRNRLSASGVMSMNLWSGDFITARELIEQIAESFDGRVLRLPVEGKENIIAIATMSGKPRQQLKQLPERAREMAERQGIEYPALLKALRRSNHSFFS